MRPFILICFLILGSISLVRAGNVQVENILLSKDIPNNNYRIQFDVSWENSWRTSTYESNYDAVWVFFKYRYTSDYSWSHVSLNSVTDTPAGAEVLVSNTATGVFVQRSQNGLGDIDFQNIELVWNQELLPSDEEIEICAFAIEMVYIPEAPFEAGDGTFLVGGIFATGGTDSPKQIDSEDELVLGGNSFTSLTNQGGFGMTFPDDYDTEVTQLLPASFPKGFQAFYMMKYEITQGQYAAFLSTLTNGQYFDRYPDFYSFNEVTDYTDGYSVRQVADPNIFIADFPDRAMNYIDWVDLAAYADWSGLRPMTELEYEKASRGTRLAVEHEYSWGNASIYSAEYSILNPGTPTEVIANPGIGVGNAIVIGPELEGPRRVGIAAASFANPSRQEAGASFYGVMDLTGNVQEIVVCTGTPEGRSFDGSMHGDGTYDASDIVLTWPAVTTSSGGVIGLGTGSKGGAWNTSAETISNRGSINFRVAGRFSDAGGRLVSSNF